MNQIVLIQPNFKIGGGSFTGYWLPYSVGCLWSYAAQEDWVRDNFEVADIIYRREEPCKLVERIKNCKVFFFSCYMWNWEYNKHVAQKIKESNPESIIVFGGPQVTSRPEEEQFFVKHPYVDSISLSEGEQSFVEMLNKILKGETLDKIYQGGRLTELDIPSPYLTGVFDKIMADAPKDDLWNGTIETNRGCPFACTFCDGGSLTYAKIKKFPVPKVLQELTWMSEKQVDYVTIADANFGVFTDRDLEFTEKLVELQNEYGYPKVVDATWYKNSSDEILEIVKKFISSGFNRGLTLSVQSMDMDVLDEIKRRNMEMSDLKMIFDKCNRENIPSYTELILGLPKETYESWKRGVCEVLDAGQHNAIESWLAQLLENAHMNLPEEREKHGLTTVIVENYISGFKEEDNIPEKVELVTGTKYMPTPKFIDAWSYSWMINNFHNFGWSQVITRFLRMYKDYSYEMMYDRLLEKIKVDQGPVGKAFNEARILLAEYLETGEIEVASGHTLMWEAQKDFHRFPHAVEKIVKDTFTEEFCDLNSDLFYSLMTAQENYTTKEDHYYPHQVLQEYNIYEYINGIDELKNSNVIYDIDIGENVKGEEYFNRLYFRRRQGWGKSIIKNTTKNT